jgi:hypothetical protein
MSIIRKIIQSIRLFIGKFFFRKWIKRICKNEDYKIDEKIIKKMIPEIGKNGGYIVDQKIKNPKLKTILTQEKAEELCDVFEIDPIIKRQLIEGEWKKFTKAVTIINIKKMRKFQNLVNKYNQIVKEYV